MSRCPYAESKSSSSSSSSSSPERCAGREGSRRCESGRASGSDSARGEGMQGEDEEDLMDFMVRFSNHVDSPEFNKRMARFFKENCHMVDMTTSEHSLEVYELYQTYQGHIDDMLEEFVDKEGLASAKSLVAKIRAASEANSFANEYVQFILDVVDYESFAACLRQYWCAFARNNGIPLPGDKKDGAKKDGNAEIESKAESKHSHK